MTSLYFVYQTLKGHIDGYIVTNPVETDQHIQGYITPSNAFRTFRKDGIIETVNDEQALKQRTAYWHSQIHTIKPRTTKPNSRPRPKTNQLQICFTGFKEADKTRLSSLAKEANIAVTSSVTVHLDFLCCGYNAGAKKIEKAREQNALILTEEQFINLIETGEIPEH
jgi:NAD-dependent DNA ligase